MFKLNICCYGNIMSTNLRNLQENAQVAVAALVLALKMKNIEVKTASGYCW